jgi:cytochrome c peroxidase
MRRLVYSASALAVIGGAALAGLQVFGGPRWTEGELALVRSLSLEALPPHAGGPPPNRVANDPAAAELGRAIFFDTRFSGNRRGGLCDLPLA